MHQLVSPPATPLSPEPPADLRRLLAGRFRTASFVLLGIVTAMAVAALSGWTFAISALKSVLPGLGAMPVSAASAIFLSALAILLGNLPSRLVLRDLGLRLSMLIVVVVAALTVVEHLTGWNLYINQYLGSGDDPTGRMALTTSVALLMIHAGLWLAEWPGRYDFAQAVVLGASLVATFDGVGYVFGLQRTIDPGTYGVMELHSAVALLLLALAFLFGRADQGVMEQVIDPGPGGIVLRLVMPVVIALPLAIAWLGWHGVRSVTYTPEFAITLVVTLSIVALALAMLAGSYLLRSFEEQRVAAEMARIRSEARLRRAVTEAPIPMLIHDRDQILNMSRQWANASGYTVDDAPTFSAWLERVQPKRTPALNDYLRALAKANDTVSCAEQDIRARDGSVRIWEFSSTPLEAVDTGDQLFVTTAVDVTWRKQAENDLRKVNEDLEHRISQRTAEITQANDSLRRQSDQLREQALLLDLVRDGILVRDLYGTIVYWSTGAAELYGWEKDQALGKVSHQLLKTEYPLRAADIEAHVLQHGFWEGETIQVTKSGVRLSVESRWTLTRTERGAPEGFLEVNRDITARKRAQDSLKDSELRFRAVAETAIEGIISVEASGTIRYWNPGAERLFGQAAAEAVGASIGTVILGDALAGYLAPQADRSLGTTFEATGRRRDRTEFPIEVSVSSWVTTQGGRWFTIIIRDITARKQAERALQAKAEELTRSNQELEQFAYVASHDLQEPLRMVSNYTQLLGKRYRDKLDTDAQEFIDFAVDGAKRMQELIHDLLQFARVGTRGKEFKRVPADRVVADALANLATAIAEADAEVVVDTLPSISCDASQMAQVFQNLIGNAVKFQTKGQRPVVRISATREHRAWTFTVKDNGIGIDAKYFDRIFQMFQRLHTRSEYSGTGIGLALCKKIIERHGGRIRVESEPGHGTTFSFTMPDVEN
jgi:PAS domain S-box-containing protein